MNRATVNCQSCLMHRLRKSRMRKTGQGQIFCTRAKFHGNNTLSNNLRRLWTYNMEAQNSVCLLVGNNLHHTRRRVGGHSTTISCKRESTDFVSFAFGLELLFGFAYPGHFGRGVNDVWNAVVIYLRLMPGNPLSNHNALFRGFMSQHRPTHHVAYRPNARRFGFALIVNEDKAALIHVDAGICREQIVGVWTTTNSHDQLVNLQFLFAFAVFVAHVDQLALDLGAGYAATHNNIQALLAELLESLFGNLLVNSWQEGALRFQYCDF